MTSVEDIGTAGVAVENLVVTLGTEIVRTGDDLVGRRFADWSGVPADEPLALILPRDTQQLAAAMQICHAHGQRVVVQGGLTGLAGAASVRRGEVVVSLERMRAIEEIDPVSATMTVQAGAILQSVQDAAAGVGRYFPLDLGARGSCTIGGLLATNAGGNRVIKYGMARSHVLGLEAVLPDGRIVGSLDKMLKNNSGYDLKDLLIGSEGTLAVITRAVLRLTAAPQSVSLAWVGLDSFEQLTRLLRSAQAGLSGQVSAFEVMWPSYYDFVLGHFPDLRRPLAGQHRYHVLLETDGPDPERQAAEFEAFLADMLDQEVIADAAIAMSGKDSADFWAIRDAPGEFPSLLPGLVAFDISFAVRDIEHVSQRVEDALATDFPEALCLLYGHLGDGNLHLIVHCPDIDAATTKAIEARVYDIVGDEAGSVSAEHGIGLKKRNVLSKTRSDVDLDCMGAIKQALDPHGILGIGRIFIS